jgi:hypothetical protein
MGRGKIASYYERLSPEDQRTFDRWLTANTIFSLIFAIGIIAMALSGSKSVGPGDAAVATTRAPDVAASEARHKPPFEIARGAPEALARMFEFSCSQDMLHGDGVLRGRVAAISRATDSLNDVVRHIDT